MGDNHEIARRYLKMFYRSAGPISIKLGTNHAWVTGTPVFNEKDHSILKKGIMVFFLYINLSNDMIIA